MVSFLPQIAKIWKDRDATGVSLQMFAVAVTAFILGTVYGVLSKAWPVVASNVVCRVLSGIILALRLRFGAATGQEPRESGN